MWRDSRAVCAEWLKDIEDVMPEIRTSLSVELHRKLKGEAVERGMHLKHLVAQILEEHAKDSKANRPQRQHKSNLR